MLRTLSGKEVAATLTENLKTRADALKAKGIEPRLDILRVGANDSDLAYERGALKRAEKVGVNVVVHQLSEDISQAEMEAEIQSLNENKDVHGVLMFRPLPKSLDEKKLANMLDPNKDVDSMTDASITGVFTDDQKGFPPCTAEAAVAILKHYDIPLEGKKLVVIGRSLVIGKPVAMLLLKENATLTICHSRTKKEDMEKYCKDADIIVAAVGHANTVNRNHMRDGQCIIDVGINFNEEGKMVGDVNFDDASEFDLSITPVPGGVGAVTSTLLMKHLIEGAEKL